MALALTSAQLAKETATSDFGIGEEVATHFLGWQNSKLAIVCQMRNDLFRADIQERFIQSIDLCSILRRYWWVTSISMVAEGYCSFDKTKTLGMDLADAFLNKKMPVSECITVSHVSIDSDGHINPAAMIAAPYSVDIGKKITWKELLVYPRKPEKNLKQSKWPVMLEKCLKEEPLYDMNEAQLANARQELSLLGFLIQEI
jgi:hypothetical protein